MSTAASVRRHPYRWILATRRLLRGPGRGRRAYDSRAQVAAATSAYWLVRAFYLFTFYLAFRTLRDVYRLSSSGREVDPLWPVFWVNGDNLEAAAAVLGLGFLAASMAAVAWPSPRWPRVLVALFYLQCLALENSFGSINHYGHFGLWMMFCFAALPVATPDHLAASRDLRQIYLAVFFTTQCLVALFYTLSGAYKAFYGFYVPEGAVSSLAPDALPLLVVQRWLQTGENPLLADLFIGHLWLAWPGHLAVIYIELFALVAIFRPELHRVWGFALMTFHLLVWLVLSVAFPYQPMIAGLLFLCSPFHPKPPPSAIQVLRQLPVIGDAAWLLWGREPRLASQAAR